MRAAFSFIATVVATPKNVIIFVKDGIYSPKNTFFLAKLGQFLTEWGSTPLNVTKILKTNFSRTNLQNGSPRK